MFIIVVIGWLRSSSYSGQGNSSVSFASDTFEDTVNTNEITQKQTYQTKHCNGKLVVLRGGGWYCVEMYSLIPYINIL
jgi:hypothetical protein